MKISLLWCRNVLWLIVCGFYLVSNQAFAQETHDFTSGSVDPTITLRGTEYSDTEGGITLSVGETSGTIEIPFSEVAGKQIQLDLNRINLINDSGFDSHDGAIKAMPVPAGASNWFGIATTYYTDCAAKPDLCLDETTAGEWFVQYAYLQDAASTETAGSRKITYDYYGIAQIVPVYANDDLYLTFDYNTLYQHHDDAQRPTGKEELNVNVSFLDASFNVLSFYDPRPNGTSTTVQGGAMTTFQNMGNFRYEDSLLAKKIDSTSDGFVTKTIRLHVLDCNTKVMYEGDSIVTSTDLNINNCRQYGSTSGRKLFTDDTVKYMVVNFDSTAKVTDCSTGVGSKFSSGKCSGTLIDNVKLDPLNQVRMEWVDSFGGALNYSDGTPMVSYQDKGFYLDPSRVDSATLSKIAKLRITLKSYGSAKPTLKKVLLTTGVDVTVSTNSSSPTITRTGPTFSTVSANYSPYPEYDLRGDFATEAMRTKCDSIVIDEDNIDPSNRNSDTTCIQSMVEHNMNMMVPIITTGHVPIRWDDSIKDYYVGWKDGEVVGKNPGWSTQGILAAHLIRMKELLDMGFTLSNVAGAVSHMTAFSDTSVLIGDSSTFDKVCPFHLTLPTDPSTALTQATAAQQECCFTYDSAGLVTGYTSFGNQLCPLGVLQDFGPTRRNGYDQAFALISKYTHYFYDLYDGSHSLVVNDGVHTDNVTVTFPQANDFIIAGEVNDNNIGVATCLEAQYWSFKTTDPTFYICRSKEQVDDASACPAGSTCKSVTDFWNQLAADLKDYDDGRRSITIQLPQTNKRYSNPAQLIDVLYNDEVWKDLDGDNFNSVAFSTVDAGFWHPEDLYQQYEALKAVAKERLGWDTNLVLNFNDVRASNSWSFDPGCDGFLDTCSTTETNLYNPVEGTCGGTASSLNDYYYGGSDCNKWTTADVAACRTPGDTTYSHYGRGWGALAGQKVLTRLTLVALSLPSNKLIYQGNVFSPERGNINDTNVSGNVCIRTWRDANAGIFYRSPTSTQDIYGQESLTVGDEYEVSFMGDNLSSYSHQLLHSLLGSPFDTKIAVNESTWTSEGEKYYSALFQSTSDPTTFYLALWWMPEYIYGYNPMSLYDINSRYDNMFQFLSPYIEDGYIEKRLVNVTAPVSGNATLIPLDGTASSNLTTSGNVIKSVPIGELPVLIQIKASSTTPIVSGTSNGSSSGNSTGNAVEGQNSPTGPVVPTTGVEPAEETEAYGLKSAGGGGCSLRME